MDNNKLLALIHKNLAERQSNKNQDKNDSSEEYQISVQPPKKQKQTKLDIFMHRIKNRDQAEKQQLIQSKPIIQQSANKGLLAHRRENNGREKISANNYNINGNNNNNKQAEILLPYKYLTDKADKYQRRQENKPKIHEFYEDTNQRMRMHHGYMGEPTNYSNKKGSQYTLGFQDYRPQKYTDREKQILLNAPSAFDVIRNKAREQKRIKRQKQKQQQKAIAEKRKKQQQLKTIEGFSAFMDHIFVDKKKPENRKNQQQLLRIDAGDNLKNLDLYNNVDQNQNKGADEKEEQGRKPMNSLIYKQRLIQVERVPLALLKILLSFEFSTHFLVPETKKVPNTFSDQLTYKKIFHYLVTNQCLADIHLRMKKVQQERDKSQPIPITISYCIKNSNGFVTVHMTEIENKNILKNQIDKQSFMLKNLWLSRNRIGIITNKNKFEIQNFGVPSRTDKKSYFFLCYLQTPENKQQLSGEVKGLAIFRVQQLEMIMKEAQSRKAYFYDLEKISTQIREYLGISNLYQTDIAPLIYNPHLLEKQQYQIVNENQRQMLEPILSRLQQEFNKTQYKSIREMILRDQGIVLLQGPPGTGKTTTLMGLLSAEYHYFKFICPSQETRKILICAPSNAAIDHITKRLVCQGLISTEGCQIYPNILRVGIVETQDVDIRKVSLDDICEKKMSQAKKQTSKKNSMSVCQIKEKLIQLYKNAKQAQLKHNSHPNLQTEEKKKRLSADIRQYQSMLYANKRQKLQLKQTYQQYQKKLFDEADIILTTLSSSGSERMEKLRGCFGCLIVDEAAQSTQPNLLIPLQSFVKKVLLIGDPCQLPSTTLSQDSQITLFNRSMFERFIDAGVKPYFLNIQYRMAPSIRQFASNSFYQGRLLDDSSVVERYKNKVKLKALTSQTKEKKIMQNQVNQEGEIKQQEVQYQNNPLKKLYKFFNRNSIFIDVKFGQEQFVYNSYRNTGQGAVVSYILFKFLRTTNLSIGVITPYQSQRKHLLKCLHKDIQRYNKGLNFEQDKKNKKQKQLAQKDKSIQNKYVAVRSYDDQKKQQQEQNLKREKQFLSRVMINTVDSFQGQQKDIIIVACVRSNKKGDIGFMKDQRRVNVALTRSRHLLIVIGSGDTLGSNETWNKLLQWNEDNKTYYQINDRQAIKNLFIQIEDGYSQVEVHRKKYNKMSTDLRKIARNQIRGEDFGIKSGKNKKVKTENGNGYYQVHHKNSNNKKKSIQERLGIIKPKQTINDDDLSSKLPVQQSIDKYNNSTASKADNQIQKQQNSKQKQQIENFKMLEAKQQRQNQAMRIQQINKRLKQLQLKMINQNSGFAQLFK